MPKSQSMATKPLVTRTGTGPVSTTDQAQAAQDLAQFAAQNPIQNSTLDDAKKVLKFLRQFSPFHMHYLGLAGTGWNAANWITVEQFEERFKDVPNARQTLLCWQLIPGGVPIDNPTNSNNVGLVLDTLYRNGPVTGLGLLITEAGFDGSYPERYYIDTPEIRPTFVKLVSSMASEVMGLAAPKDANG